jgi:hypothetical protein
MPPRDCPYVGTNDGDLDLSLDDWAACASAALEQLQDEIAALPDAEQQRVCDAILQRLAPPVPLPD